MGLGRWFLCAAVIGGCAIEANLVPCGELTCPASLVCVGGTTCASREDVDACLGVDESGSCVTRAIAAGTCLGGICYSQVCGDGRTEIGESCDDGNQRYGDGCSGDCLSTEVCGNAIADGIVGEECDRGIAGLSNDGCTSHCTVEFEAWEEVTTESIGARSDHAMAYDAYRQQLITYGGTTNSVASDTTWTWTGTSWMQLRVAITPGVRSGHAMAYDSLRHRIVMFGGAGSSGALLGDTWEWDGLAWVARASVTSPPARKQHVMAYDSVRHRIVLFGGSTLSSTLSDTWEWDGTDWHAMTPAMSPGERFNPAMGFDELHGEMVLHGGVIVSGPANGETWIWNGTNWSLRAPSGPGRSRHALVYDGGRNELLMVGGDVASPIAYRWDGAAWTQINAGGPTVRWGPAAAYDGKRDVVVVFGGRAFTGQAVADLWEWNGSAWSPPQVWTVPFYAPTMSMTFDPTVGRTLLYVGNQAGEPTLWEWNGLSWGAIVSASDPPSFPVGVIAYDTKRSRLVLFAGVPAETWEWDGTTWEQRTPAVSPSPRDSAAMIYDDARGRMVMFGGFDSNEASHSEVWEWDGTNWFEHPATIPDQAATYPSLAFDRVRKRVVMFGYGGTREWDGSTWTDVPSAPDGVDHAYGAAAYDPLRRRAVAFGGGSMLGGTLTQEWDGSKWSLRYPSHIADVYYRSWMTYDEIAREIVLVNTVPFGLLTTWRLRFDSAPFPADVCSNTLDSDGDDLVGCADPDCGARCTPGCLLGTTCDPNAAHCGDGTCAIIESAAFCPADCL